MGRPAVDTGVTQLFWNWWLPFIFKNQRVPYKTAEILFYRGIFICKGCLSVFFGVFLLEKHEYTQFEASASCTAFYILPLVFIYFMLMSDNRVAFFSISSVKTSINLHGIKKNSIIPLNKHNFLYVIKPGAAIAQSV